MPRSLGPGLPDAIRTLLDGRDLAGKIGLTFLLLTTDEQGWPHLAMLSAGELLATSDRRLDAGLWLHSASTHNLERDGRGLLALVSDGAGYYLRVHAGREADLDLGDDGRLAHFVLDIDDVLEDAVAYATLTSGIRFELHQPEQVVARWQRTIEALQAASA